MKLIVFSLTALFLITSCQYKNKPNIEKIKVSSKDFSEGKTIPARFTCVDKNISPDISLQPTPNGTKSFAVITDNPDAPSGNFVH